MASQARPVPEHPGPVRAARAGQVPPAPRGPGGGGGPPSRGGRGRPPSRKALLAIAGAVLAVLVAGLVLTVRFGKPPTAEMVIVFSPRATAQQEEAVRVACPGAGNAVQKPADTGADATNAAYPLRYDISRANDMDQTTVMRCVSGRPGVDGVDFNRGDQP